MYFINMPGQWGIILFPNIVKVLANSAPEFPPCFPYIVFRAGAGGLIDHPNRPTINEVPKGEGMSSRGTSELFSHHNVVTEATSTASIAAIRLVIQPSRCGPGFDIMALHQTISEASPLPKSDSWSLRQDLIIINPSISQKCP